jgi:hypothetical protein
MIAGAKGAIGAKGAMGAMGAMGAGAIGAAWSNATWSSAILEQRHSWRCPLTAANFLEEDIQ